MDPFPAVRKGPIHVIADIDDVGASASHDRTAEDAGHVGAQLYVEMRIDDVDDLVDHQSHNPAFVREDQRRLLAFRRLKRSVDKRNERRELSPILDDALAVDPFDSGTIELLQTRDK